MCASALFIPPSSLDSRSSGISLCAELTLVTIGCGQGACLKGSLLTSTRIASSMLLEALARGARRVADGMQREPRTAAIACGFSPH